MNYNEVESWLFSRRRMGMKYGLDRIRSLMTDLGEPQRNFRTVHVVGTNGKGSTVALLAEIARQLGFVTGRNTSPHLLDFRERITLDGRWIPKSVAVSFIEEHRDLMEYHTATFFEVVTAMAAWFFRLEQADWVIAESGLGGRFDASRIFHGEGTVFTGVQIEHSRILGKTRPLITTEKIAIAREGSMLISAGQTPDVEDMIEETVTSKDLIRVFPEPVARGALPGEHQKRNAALAFTAAVRLFGRPRDEVEKAFESACRSLRWPGRLDLLDGKPSILFDVAHNPEAIDQLLEYVSEWKKPVPAVIGFLADKQWKKMIDQLSPVVGPVVATTPVSERKLSAEELASGFRSKGIECHWRDSIPEALALGRSLSDDRMVVAGSFFIVGEAMLTAWKKGWIELPEGEPSQALEC